MTDEIKEVFDKCRKVFETDFITAMNCGSSTYEHVEDLGDYRKLRFKVTNITGNPLTPTVAWAQTKMTVHLYTTAGSDALFYTHANGTIARRDNFHGDVLHDHSGELRRYGVHENMQLSSAYLAGSSFLTGEIQELARKRDNDGANF